MSEKRRINSNLTLCSFAVFCLIIGTRAQLLECIFAISKRLAEFDLF